MFADPVLVLRGEDIQVTETIKIHQPTVDEIIDYGEHKFLTTFSTLASIPSDMKSSLWDMGIDWCKISDFELFIRLSRAFPKEATELILPGISLSDMTICESGLMSEDQSILIDEDTYTVMVEYIREFLGIKPKVEKAANKITHDVLIEEDRKKKKRDSGKVFQSLIFPMIITLVNTEEFPYDYKSAGSLTLFQMNKSFQQIQKKKHANALMQGSMSGFVDTSKLSADLMNWTYKEE